MLYRPKSEHAGRVEDYVKEYHRRHPERLIKLLDVDTRQGENIAKLYGVVRYPALLVSANDGALIDLWQDEQLPLMSELDFYTRAVI